MIEQLLVLLDLRLSDFFCQGPENSRFCRPHVVSMQSETLTVIHSAVISTKESSRRRFCAINCVHGNLQWSGCDLEAAVC